MSTRESKEMYLETIYVLENSHGHAHSSEIAKRLKVSKPSVTKAMNCLKTEGLINKETYGTITLTEKGKIVSERIYSRHKVLTKYLEHSLKLTNEEAAKNACKMEHVITDDMLDAVRSYLKKNNISSN